MIHAQATKVVNSVAPASVDGASATIANTVDCKGWDYCQFYVGFGVIGATATALKIQESDDDATWTDVVGTRVGTDTDMDGAATSLPGAGQADGVYRFDLDCRKRKRYLQPIVTAGAAATLIGALAVLSRGAIGPHQASDTNATDVMRV